MGNGTRGHSWKVRDVFWLNEKLQNYLIKITRISDITSIFYQNGFGGATILHSTLPSHKLDEWDGIPKRKVNPKQSNKEMFLRPHSICSIRTNAKRRGDLWRLLRDDIEMITEEQNI